MTMQRLEWRVDSATYGSMRRVAHMAGLRTLTEDAARQAERDGMRENTWRAAIHEAGHCIAYLVSSTAFVHASINEGGGGELVSVSRDDGWRPAVPIRTRIALALAGPVCESVYFDRIDCVGAFQDLRQTLGKVGIVNPDALRQDHAGIGIVRDIADHVRGVIVREEAATTALAKALLERRRLSRGRCIGVVARAGLTVDGLPKFQRSPLGSELRQDREEVARDKTVWRQLSELADSRRVAREDAKPKPKRTPKDADAQWAEYCRVVPDRPRRRP